MNPKNFSQYKQQIYDEQCTKDELTITDYNLGEQEIDRELFKIKECFQKGSTSPSSLSFWIIYFIMYQREIQTHSSGCILLNTSGTQ